MAKLGEYRVSPPNKYDNDMFAIEIFSYGQKDEPFWGFYDWEEMSLGMFWGPEKGFFKTYEQAHKALQDGLEYIDGLRSWNTDWCDTSAELD